MADPSPHPIEQLAAVGPWDGPSYRYRGADIHCCPGLRAGDAPGASGILDLVSCADGYLTEGSARLCYRSGVGPEVTFGTARRPVLAYAITAISECV